MQAMSTRPMHIFTPRRFPVLALFISLSLLCGAWFFQYGLGYAPCQMCYWQRHAHKLIIALALLAIILTRFARPDNAGHARLWTYMIILGFLISAGLALWHMGVEYKWWEGPKTCSGTPQIGTLTGNDLLNSLDEKINPPACNEIVWSLLGLSMAGWNMVISLCGCILGFLSLKTKHG